MTTLILLLFFLILSGIVLKIQLNFQKLNDNHSTNLKNLNGELSRLIKHHDLLYQKVTLADSFNSNYKESEKVIAEKIVELVSDFLSIISKEI